jgi:Raf kinase inhibitor-like YbhB/YbcL family protein
MMSRIVVGLALAVVLPMLFFAPQTRAGSYDRFQVSSSTFSNSKTLPLSMINNIANSMGTNSCTPNGAAGGNQSPELSWTHAKRGTKSFVVVLYDITAAFTHWGMYNIAASATGLPENAGVAGSTYGDQIVNDFFSGAQYGGPCPPAGVSPDVHKYRFTVYDLDTTLTLPSSPNFPAAAETLYQALIQAGRRGHILASASLIGLYSSTPSP